MAEDSNKDNVEPVAKESMESIMTKQLMGEGFFCVLTSSPSISNIEKRPNTNESLEDKTIRQTTDKDVSECVVEPITKEAAEAIKPEDLTCEDFTCILRSSDHGRDDVNLPVVDSSMGVFQHIKRRIGRLFKNN